MLEVSDFYSKESRGSLTISVSITYFFVVFTKQSPLAVQIPPGRHATCTLHISISSPAASNMRGLPIPVSSSKHSISTNMPPRNDPPHDIPTLLGFHDVDHPLWNCMGTTANGQRCRNPLSLIKTELAQKQCSKIQNAMSSEHDGLVLDEREPLARYMLCGGCGHGAQIESTANAMLDKLNEEDPVTPALAPSSQLEDGSQRSIDDFAPQSRNNGSTTIAPARPLPRPPPSATRRSLTVALWIIAIVMVLSMLLPVPEETA